MSLKKNSPNHWRRIGAKISPISSNINVGIGTPDANAKLHVLSDVSDVSNAELTKIDSVNNLTPGNRPRHLAFYSTGTFVGDIHEETIEGLMVFNGKTGFGLQRDNVYYLVAGSSTLNVYKPLNGASADGITLISGATDRSVNIKRYSAGQTNNLLNIQTELGVNCVTFDKDGIQEVYDATNLLLKSKQTPRGFYISRTTDGAYVSSMTVTSDSLIFDSRNTYNFNVNTVNVLQLGSLQTIFTNAHATFGQSGAHGLFDTTGNGDIIIRSGDGGATRLGSIYFRIKDDITKLAINNGGTIDFNLQTGQTSNLIDLNNELDSVMSSFTYQGYLAIGRDSVSQITTGFGGSNQIDKLHLYSNTASSITGLILSGVSGGCVQITNENMTPKADIGVAGADFYFVNRAGGQLRFYYDASNAGFNVSATGNTYFGGGIQNAKTKLQVKGTCDITNTLGSSFLTWSNASGDAYRAAMNLSATYEDFEIYTATGSSGAESFTRRIVVENDTGNVQIGPNKPLSKLDVYNGTFNISQVLNNTFFTMRNVSDLSAKWAINLDGSSDFDLYRATGTYGAETFTQALSILNSNGYVGVGTNSPVANLEVANNTGAIVAISTNNVAGTTANSLYPTLNFLGYADKIMGQIKVRERQGSVTHSEMIFSSRNSSDVLTEYMRIDGANGYVGVNNPNPTSHLDQITPSDIVSHKIKLFTGQTSDIISVVDSLDVDIFKFDAQGDLEFKGLNEINMGNLHGTANDQWSSGFRGLDIQTNVTGMGFLPIGTFSLFLDDAGAWTEYGAANSFTTRSPTSAQAQFEIYALKSGGGQDGWVYCNVVSHNSTPSLNQSKFVIQNSNTVLFDIDSGTSASAHRVFTIRRGGGAAQGGTVYSVFDNFGRLGINTGDVTPDEYLHLNNGNLKFTGSARIAWVKYTANSITLSSVTTAGTVSDLQTGNDGNVLTVTEAAAAAGQNIIIDFVNVTSFNWVKVLTTYEGSNIHALVEELYNWSTASWDKFDAVQTGFSNTGTIFENHDFFIPDATNYIGTGANEGQVRVRFSHPVSGNVAHIWYFDEVSLWQ